jgi:aryl-phospho-beta-D-glucosidase BglC (GH1 family)
VGILILSAVVFSSTLNSVIISSSGTIETLPNLQLQVSGTQLLNGNNQTVYLRGVDACSFLESSTGSFIATGGTYTELGTTWSNASVVDDILDWQSHGFNFVRILIPCDWWLNDSAITYQGAATSIGMRDAITEFVQIAQPYGLYIEVCPWEDVGYPESGQPASGSLPYGSGEYFANESAFVSFWAGTGTSVANVLGGYPNVLFNLYNEPDGPEASWAEACQECINAIRAVSQNCIVVQWGYDGYFGFPVDANLNGTNIIYDDHIYRGGSNTFTLAEYTTAELNSTLYNTYDYGEVVGHYCFMIDEIGCDLGQDAYELTYYANMLGLLDSWGAGYAGWVYEPGGSGYVLLQGSTFPFSLNSAGQELVAAIQAGTTGVAFSNIGTARMLLELHVRLVA